MHPTRASLLVAVALVAGLPASPAGALIAAAPDEAIAFWSARGPDREIFLVQVNGGVPLGNLTQDEREDVDPAWSVDGRRIAFARRAPGSDFEIVAMDSEGGPGSVLTSNAVDDRQPAWSLTDKIAFARRTSSDSSQIFTMSQGGTNVLRITPEVGGRFDSAPAWSPDETQIAYVSQRAGAFPAIYVMNADGSGDARLTTSPCPEGNPSWDPVSALGDRVAFDRRCDPGPSNIVVYSFLGPAENEISVPMREAYDPDFSPNGDEIAFASHLTSGGDRDIWVMEDSGAGAVALAGMSAASDLAPDWHHFYRTGGPCEVLGTMSGETLTGTGVLCGLGGDDTLPSTLAAERLRGGGGEDTADYGSSTTSVAASLATGIAAPAGEAADTLVGIENLAGGSAADTLTGDNEHDNVLEGRAGDDMLRGGGGRDAASYEGAPGAVMASIVAGSASSDGDGDTDTFPGADIEDLRGSAQADQLTGSEQDNTLEGLGGADMLFGLGGSDLLRGGTGTDQLDGGEGSDAADYRLVSGGVTASIPGGASNDGQGGTDSFTAIEVIEGTDAADNLSGGPNADTLVAGAGDDSLDGGEGNDLLRGGDGADTIFGGTGSDRLQGEGDGDPRLDGGDGNDNISGGVGGDVLLGSAGSDVLAGDAGDDRLLGGPSGDTLRGGDGADRLAGGDGNDKLYGGDSGDTLNGDKGADRLYGEDGRDVVKGGRSSDRLYGGNGNDRLLAKDRVRDRLSGGKGKDGGSWDRRRDRVVGVETSRRPGVKVRKTTVAPGVKLTRYIDKRTPRRTFVLTVDPKKAPVMDVALAQDQLAGFERTSSMGKRKGAIAAVNGDFGLPSGRPSFDFAEDGALRQSSRAFGYNVAVSQDEQSIFIGHPDTALTAIEAAGEEWRVARWNDGAPGLGELAAFSAAGGSFETPPGSHCSVRLIPSGLAWGPGQVGVRTTSTVDTVSCGSASMPAGTGIVLSAPATSDEARFLTSLPLSSTITLTWSLGWRGVLDALGGYPMLVRDGTVVAKKCGEPLCGVHPRTGVGATPGGKLLLVVVDGRRRKYSRGLTLLGFAQEMERLGAAWAMNLDGGGSSTMWVKGRGIVNRPSDGSERAVSSAFAVLPGADPGEAAPLSTATIMSTPAEDLAAGMLAARDAGSTGGLAEALADGALARPGTTLPPGLLRVLRLFRAA